MTVPKRPIRPERAALEPAAPVEIAELLPDLDSHAKATSWRCFGARSRSRVLAEADEDEVAAFVAGASIVPLKGHGQPRTDGFRGWRLRSSA
jgi:hypothetical protein